MQLIDLLLHKNNFSGDIPSTVEGLIHIEILRLDLNQLSGPIPSNLRNITNLTALYLGSNSFTDSRVPSWISSHENLRLLSMDSSHLTGNLSADIFSLGPNLSTVSLASNNFTGSLNLSLANAALLLVNVTNNNFTSFVNSNHTVEVILHGNPFCSVNQTRCDELDNLQSSPPVSRNTSLCSNSCSDNSTFNPKLSGNCQCFRPLNAIVNFLALKIPSLEIYNLTLMEEQFAVGLNRSTVKSFAIAGSQIVIEPITPTQALVSIFPPTNYATWSVNDAALILYAINNKEILFPSIGPTVCAFIGDPYNTVAIANSRSTNGLSTGAKVGIAMAVIFFVIAMIIASLYAVREKKRATWIEAGEIDTGSPKLMAAHWFSLQEIRKCTDNFSQSNEIGEGGYGKVYKGYLPTGQKIAIKRAGSDSLQSAAEFKFEIELLSSVHHHNLVGLIGFCFEEGEQILVYEFMPNGTLRESLSGATDIQMDWQRRISVALNAARGIVYLHTGVNPQVIHRDIKSSNIFLDDRLFAKVADFGLSKLAPVDNDSTPLSSQVKGTMGYLDPDYFLTNRLTHKSDVYSFGVVLLELITGRPPIQGGKYVVREIRTAYAQGGMEQVVKSMVDPKLKDYPLEALEKLVKLALVSVEDNPQRRPTMTEVMKEVESLSEVTSIKSDVQGGKPKNTHLEEGTKAHMRQKLANLFQHSGNYTAMFANVQPK
ncbi:hypothetical protein KP509_35G067000 [Ceratopteris richardii]|nr:hypothetical protein KP509_35G067000 [Ceratopteris richardii]